jgi:hypothetical protein
MRLIGIRWFKKRKVLRFQTMAPVFQCWQTCWYRFRIWLGFGPEVLVPTLALYKELHNRRFRVVRVLNATTVDLKNCRF